MLKYVKNSIKKSLSFKPIQWLIRVCCLTFCIWSLLLGVEILLNTSVIYNNTDLVDNDTSKQLIKEIDSVEGIILEDGSVINKDVNYIIVMPSSKTYYIEGNGLTVCMDIDDYMGNLLFYYIACMGLYVLMYIVVKKRDCFLISNVISIIYNSLFIMNLLVELIVDIYSIDMLGSISRWYILFLGFEIFFLFYRITNLYFRKKKNGF